MRTKVLGRTNIEVAIVGLGGATLGIPDAASQELQYEKGIVCMNESQGISTVIEAIRGGVTLIDTAPWYGDGASERIIARVFRERPELKRQCIVTTKVGHHYSGDDFDFSYDAVMRSVEDSQKRLEQDRFTILYLHDPMDQDMKFVMSKKGAFGALRELKRQDVTEYIGVAANDPETNADYIETGEFDAAVIPNCFNLVNQIATKRILPAAIKYNVGLVCPSSLERGLLATGPLEGARYHGRKHSQGCLDQVAMIKNLCSEWNIPLVAVALQWCTRHPQVAAAIPGAAFPKESRQNTEAGSFEIPEKFWEELAPLIRHWDFPMDGINRVYKGL